MSKRGKDTFTMDLFRDYEPPEVAIKFPEEVTKGGTLDVKIARAISQAMQDCGKSRKQIAEEMSAYLNENVTENMLDQYASTARKDHRIRLDRFIALVQATACYELIGFVCEFVGLVAVPRKYADIIELWMVEERQAELERSAAALRGRVGGTRR